MSTAQDKIHAMREGGKRLAHVKSVLMNAATPGVSFEELEAVAQKRGVSKSVVLREALTANLHQQRAAANVSAFDVMRSACGVVKGGPKDRSWNKKYMKGYGRD